MEWTDFIVALKTMLDYPLFSIKNKNQGNQ